MKTFLIAATVAGLVATNAAAGGLSPPAVAPPNWNGPYAGLSYGRTTVTSTHEEYKHWRQCERGGNLDEIDAESSASMCVVSGGDHANSPELRALVGAGVAENGDGVIAVGNSYSVIAPGGTEPFRYDAGYNGVYMGDDKVIRYTSSSDARTTTTGPGGARSVFVETITNIIETDEPSESAGAFAGYRQEVGAFVLGGEAGFNGDLKSIEAQVGLNAGLLLPYVFYGFGQFDGEDTDTYGVGADMKIGLVDGMFVGAKYTQGDFGEQATVRVGFNF